LPEQFRFLPLRNLAEMFLVTAIIPAPARFIISLSHVGTSLANAMKYNPALLYLINGNSSLQGLGDRREKNYTFFLRGRNV
jgi:hypothetical protein